MTTTTRERTQKLARLQRRLAGLRPGEIDAIAAAQASRLAGRLSADELVRAESAALRDAAGGMPTRKLSIFAGALVRHLQIAANREKRERSALRPTASRRSLFKSE